MTTGKTTTFSVTGMTCDNCVHHVTEAVKGVTGVTDAQVSLAENAARVAGEFDVQAIIAAIEEEGYKASVKA
jgi:copper chaperone CopZ